MVEKEQPKSSRPTNSAEMDFARNVEMRSQQCHSFGVWDYALFGLLFAISAVIGLFFAYRARKNTDDKEEYLLGGRKMSGYAVALSLTATAMSAIAVLGTPAEFYTYGTMFWYMAISYTLMAIIVSEIYIPVFTRLHITSIYEYLELRFNKPVRLLATTVYLLNTLLYVGITIYAPALALNEVTGMNLWMSAAVTGVVCTFYTTFGGLKAVVWTDVFQCCIMWVGFVAIIIRGSVVLGGFQNVWAIAAEGSRIQYNHFETDPTVGHSFWSIVVGGTVMWISQYGCQQAMVQRYICCKSQRHAKLALFLCLLGLYIILLLTGLSGLVMYAYYAGCDPHSKGWVGASDQLMPYFVLELLHSYPGLAGFYVCSAFSGTLSTASSAINSLAACTVEDYIKPVTSMSPRNTVIVSKILVMVYGTLCIGMAVLASQLGEVLQAAFSVNGLVGGPMVGLFTLAMILPWCNSTGAFVGVLAGLGTATWVYVGSTIYPPSKVQRGVLPLSTAYCNATPDASCGFNISYTEAMAYTTIYTPTSKPELPAVSSLYAISYLYYPLVGFAVTITVGLLTSFATGHQRPAELPPETIWPIFDHAIFWWIPTKARRFLWCGVKHYEQSRVCEMKEISKRTEQGHV